MYRASLDADAPLSWCISFQTAHDLRVSTATGARITEVRKCRLRERLRHFVSSAWRAFWATALDADGQGVCHAVRRCPSCRRAVISVCSYAAIKRCCWQGDVCQH